MTADAAPCTPLCRGHIVARPEPPLSAYVADLPLQIAPHQPEKSERSNLLGVARMDAQASGRVMRGRWASQPIVLTTTAGPQQVPASTYGAWAVHEPLSDSHTLRLAWAVTHVPTGLSVGCGFPKEQARRLCQQLHRIVGDTPITGRGMPGLPPDMRQRVRLAVSAAYGATQPAPERHGAGA